MSLRRFTELCPPRKHEDDFEEYWYVQTIKGFSGNRMCLHNDREVYVSKVRMSTTPIQIVSTAKFETYEEAYQAAFDYYTYHGFKYPATFEPEKAVEKPVKPVIQSEVMEF